MHDQTRSASSAPPGAAWPLVGRAAELERIAARRAAAADGRGVVLSAPAGVGKSRLARDAVVAAGAGRRVGAAGSSATRSAAAVPLGAFAGLMPADVRSDEPLELMRRSAEALRERAGGRPIVLGVDDAQLLDPTSAALVLHLTDDRHGVRRRDGAHGEPCPDAVQSLWKDAGAVRLDLETLSEAETRRRWSRRCWARLWRSARGAGSTTAAAATSLYIRELLLGALADGALQERGGFWRLTRRPPPSRSLTELIEARMAELGRRARGRSSCSRSASRCGSRRWSTWSAPTRSRASRNAGSSPGGAVGRR